MVAALIIVCFVAVFAVYFAVTSTVLYLAKCDELYETDKVRRQMVAAARAVIPLLPDKSVDSFYADGGFAERQELRKRDLTRNTALDTFLALFKPAQSLEDSAMAYERFFGYSSAEGVARAKEAGTWHPTGQPLAPGPIAPGPRYDLEES